MKRARLRVFTIVFENFWWKMLALAVAVVIWALVASEPELSTFSTVRIEYKNLPDDLEISSEPVSTVVLELRGPSGELSGVGESIRPSVILDMSNARAGERTFPIQDGSVKLARGVRLVRSIPAAVNFRFEPRRSRTVPVEVRYSGQGQNGYEVATTEVDPKEVQVVGPRNRVQRTSEVVTDTVDVSNVVGTSEFHVQLLVEDPFVRLAGASEAVVRVTMKKR